MLPVIQSHREDHGLEIVYQGLREAVERKPSGVKNEYLKH
jgi:hypothetical protein